MALLIARLIHVDDIEPGQPKKAPFVLRTDDQLSMFFKSESKSILLRVIQHIVQFEKGSVNILMEKDEKSCEVELSSMSTHSSASPNSKSANDGVSKESTRTVRFRNLLFYKSSQGMKKP